MEKHINLKRTIHSILLECTQDNVENHNFNDITKTDIHHLTHTLDKEMNVKIKNIEYEGALKKSSRYSIKNENDEQTIIIRVVYDSTQDPDSEGLGHGIKPNQWVNVRCLRSEENELIQHLKNILNHK